MPDQSANRAHFPSLFEINAKLAETYLWPAERADLNIRREQLLASAVPPTKRAHLSPGAATVRRAQWERELKGSTRRAMSLFLAEVNREAKAALGSPVILAGGFGGAPLLIPEPFTLGAVLRAWAKFTGRVSTKIGTFGGDVIAAAERLASSSLPGKVFDAAKAVLSNGADQLWEKSQIRIALDDALSMKTGTAQLITQAGTGATELDAQGQAWESLAAAMARTEATMTAGAVTQKLLNTSDHLPYKQWIAYHDSRTRPTHVEADGQIVAVEETFTVGGRLMMHPGDPAGGLKETASCRCVLVGMTEAEMGDAFDKWAADNSGETAASTAPVGE